MFKATLFTAATLIATVSAGLEIILLDTTLMIPAEFYNVMIWGEVDAGYKTTYANTISDNSAVSVSKPTNLGGYNTESYGLTIFTEADLFFEHTLMDAYTATYQFKLTPLLFTPLYTTWSWSRFD